jgi:DNA-binding NarL/FixJ family response regulator
LATPDNNELLTDREKSILTLVATGKFDAEIASTIGISFHTVRSNMKSIFNKLKATNRTEAVNIARDKQLIT